jgi:hypothetical protein
MTKRRDKGARRSAKSWDCGGRNPKSEKSVGVWSCFPSRPRWHSGVPPKSEKPSINLNPSPAGHFLVRSVPIRLIDKRDQTQRCKACRGTQRRLPSTTSATFAVLSSDIVSRREDSLDCGGKRSATPLWDRPQPCQSGVALRFPPQSKTLWLRLRRAMPRRLVRLSADRVSTIQSDFRISDFGFPSDFGFRISDFPLFRRSAQASLPV